MSDDLARRVARRFQASREPRRIIAAKKPYAVDFTIQSGVREPMMDALSPADHARERALYPEARIGYLANLSTNTASFYWGATEHEAIQSMLNSIIEHCDERD